MKVTKESLLAIAGGAVLTAVMTLAGKSYLATESAASEAVSKNFEQQTQLEVVITKQERTEGDIRELKRDMRWVMDALVLVLQDRGLRPPEKRGSR